jgi:formiminotetrahydrofolate cyclodeaminase
MNLHEKEKKVVDKLIEEAKETAVQNPWRLAALYEMQDHLTMHPNEESIQNLDPDLETYCKAFGDMQYNVKIEIDELKD